MSENEHVAAIKRNAALVRKLRLKQNRNVAAYEIEQHADALARQLAEAEQAAWEAQQECIEKTGALAEAEQRAERLRAWACAEDELATALIALLTDAQIARPDYPDELERQASIAHTACWQAGDVEDGA